MNPPPLDPPPTTLELIDLAVAAAKRAAHSCHNDTAREHFEFALALLRETWIAESGQEARSPAQVIADVNWAMNLFASITPEPSLPKIKSPQPLNHSISR